MARIAGLAQLGECSALGFYGNRLNDRCLEILLDSEHLAGLRHLEVSNNALSNAGLEMLRDLGPGSLVGLDLSFNLFKADGLAGLLGGERSSRLSTLTLSRNGGLGLEGVRAVVDSGLRLHKLGLKWCGVGDLGLDLLAKGKTLSQVTHLDLSNNRITDRGISALARSPAVASLEVLDVGENAIRDQGWRAIAASEHLGRLRSLKGLTTSNTRGNHVSANHRAALLDSPHLSTTLKKRLKRGFEGWRRGC